MGTFVAIDFETAHTCRDSACAVALVRVERSRVVERVRRLIRPPARTWMFDWVHGIRPADVRGEPRFRDVWRELEPYLRGAEHLVAHNAPFDRSVLHACCERARVPVPEIPFLCTMRLARETWGIRPTRLPDVCARLRIPLDHHDPLSDAEACARIVLRARRRG